MCFAVNGERCPKLWQFAGKAFLASSMAAAIQRAATLARRAIPTLFPMTLVEAGEQASSAASSVSHAQR